MTISYPLSIPSIEQYEDFDLKKMFGSQSFISGFTGQAEVQDTQLQMWFYDARLARDMEKDEIAPWSAFVAALNGASGYFTSDIPNRTSPRGSASGNILVDGGSQTGQDLLLKDAPFSTLCFKQYDLIQLNNFHLHEVLVDATSDGAGALTVTLWPDLRESPADEFQIIYTNPKGAFRMSQPISSMPIQAPWFYTGSIEAYEEIILS